MSVPIKYIFFAVIGFSMLIQNRVLAQAETETKSEIFTAKNSIHAEFAGNSGGYALNYGRIIYQKNKMKLAVSAGFSMFYRRVDERISSDYWVPVFPAEITAFWGKSKHHLELGAGFNTLRNRTYIFDEDFPNNIREQIHWDQFIVGRIGYRYQKPAGGFFFRAGYTPMVEFNNSDTSYKGISFIPIGLGISLGVSF